MTPSELADRLEQFHKVIVDPRYGFVADAAAMLREAERLLRGTYRRDDQWVIARHAWLKGRTP